MKKMKKVLAMLLAMVMVLGMSVTVSANQVEKGVASKDDTATVSIEGISGGATVTLYQIAKGVYGDSGKGGRAHRPHGDRELGGYLRGPSALDQAG